MTALGEACRAVMEIEVYEGPRQWQDLRGEAQLAALAPVLRDLLSG
ncbi:hypothetical protein LCGC14_1878890 [marine sediment metagenome]|uniref:Uncharacterized protein n=1 Tax=marine sediment metagenome TaxID=412755 RepID=A0A0F9J1E0_9ZZZZ